MIFAYYAIFMNQVKVLPRQHWNNKTEESVIHGILLYICKKIQLRDSAHYSSNHTSG
jgi:hypothetical protein